MTDLSPAAQAVLDAYNAGFNHPVAVHHQPRIAAALRAAANQIEDLYCENLVIDDSDGIVFGLRQLMIIADELESL